jgi:hypothetical protein
LIYVIASGSSIECLLASSLKGFRSSESAIVPMSVTQDC